MSHITQETIRKSKIRRSFDHSAGLWWFSVVDVVAVASGSSDPRNYWKVLKNRLKKSRNELVTACNQLKMPAEDGKMYLTDVADAGTLIHIVEIISDEAVTPFRLWFARVEAIDEVPNSDAESDTGFKLRVDAYQSEKDIVVEAMIPGVYLEHLSISAEHKTLTIEGKILKTLSVPEENNITAEIPWGTFSRTVPLPALVDIDRAEATLARGVLKIKLPKIDLGRVRELKAKPA